MELPGLLLGMLVAVDVAGVADGGKKDDPAPSSCAWRESPAFRPTAFLCTC